MRINKPMFLILRLILLRRNNGRRWELAKLSGSIKMSLFQLMWSFYTPATQKEHAMLKPRTSMVRPISRWKPLKKISMVTSRMRQIFNHLMEKSIVNYQTSKFTNSKETSFFKRIRRVEPLLVLKICYGEDAVSKTLTLFMVLLFLQAMTLKLWRIQEVQDLKCQTSKFSLITASFLSCYPSSSFLRLVQSTAHTFLIT